MGERYQRSDQPIDLQAAKLMYAENEKLVAELSHALFRYSRTAGYWCMWSDIAAKNAAQDLLQRIYIMREKHVAYPYGSASQVKNAVEQLKVMTTGGPLSRQSPPAVIVFRNGTFDLNTHELVGHSPEYGATYGVTADFIKQADCPPGLDRVINTCYPSGSAPIIRAMIRWAIDPTIRYGEAFHIIGRSGSGKGLIIDFIRSLFPPEAVSQLQHPADLASPEKVHQYVLGRRLLAFPDTPAIYEGTCNTFYELVENKPVTTRKLFAGESERGRELHCRFILGSVRPLQFKDGRDGYLRRVITVHTQPREGDPDPTMRDALNGDKVRAQAISWALAMSVDQVVAVLNRNDPEGLLRDAAEQAAVASDTVSQWADQCLTAAADANSAVNESDWREMYDCYVAWCNDSNVRHQTQRTNFIGQLRAILGARRCLPRRGQRYDGGRVNIPASDHGFRLRTGLWNPTSKVLAVARMGAGGLGDIESLPQAIRSVSGSGLSNGGSGLSQGCLRAVDQGSPAAQNGCSASNHSDGGEVDQGSRPIPAESKKSGVNKEKEGADSPDPRENDCAATDLALIRSPDPALIQRPTALIHPAWHTRATELRATGMAWHTIALQLEQELGVRVDGRQVKQALG